MRIKTKLYLGLGFLFLVIVLLWGLGSFYILQMGNDSEKILRENYKSVELARHLGKSLEQVQNLLTKQLYFREKEFDNIQYTGLLNEFDSILIQEEGNITEVGEKEIVIALRGKFNTYMVTWPSSYQHGNDGAKYYFTDILPVLEEIRNLIHQISDVNMQAIVRKSDHSRQTAKHIYMYLSCIGGICLLLSFFFIINFPGYIANPIQKLNEGILAIASRNYKQRLQFNSNDEFGELAKAFNNMAERLDEYENSNLAHIIFEKKRIEAIVNNMHDPIIGLDEGKQVLFVNSEAEKILGIQSIHLVGKYAPDIASVNDMMKGLILELMMHPNNGVEKELSPLKFSVEGKESFFTKEILYINGSNSDHGLPIVIGYVIILKNVTKFLETDLARTNFIATITHELKTPIASIQMSLQLLEDERVGMVNTEQRKLVENIKEDSQRLLRITRELLDLSQAETGNLQLNFDTVAPSDIIQYAIQSMQFQAEQSNIALKTYCPDDLPSIRTDLEKTTWVITNLLSNALRYAPHGSNVIIGALQKSDIVEFSVQDFGKGIDPRYTAKVFDKYFKIPEETGLTHGTGLGLAISKEFITAQSGKIWVESKPGEGSKFVFTLPVAV
jgi:signal transduction histidine kinase